MATVGFKGLSALSANIVTIATQLSGGLSDVLSLPTHRQRTEAELQKHTLHKVLTR